MKKFLLNKILKLNYPCFYTFIKKTRTKLNTAFEQQKSHKDIRLILFSYKALNLLNLNCCCFTFVHDF